MRIKSTIMFRISDPGKEGQVIIEMKVQPKRRGIRIGERVYT
jgi:hypothetical protein